MIVPTRPEHDGYHVHAGDPPTPAQLAVLQLFAAGLTWTAAREHLGIGTATMGRRLDRLRQRCNCSTTAQLMALAGAQGWVDVTPDAGWTHPPHDCTEELRRE